MFRIFADLTKLGIVIFVLLSGVAGYALGFSVESPFVFKHFMTAVGGLFFLSAGSLALNQVQEYKIDRTMPRTAKRPIASGKITPAAAAIIAWTFLFIGSSLLFEASELAGLFGLLTVFLYNGLYTKIWKPKWVFAAIPGAIPGALPVTIGYAAINSSVWNLDSIYLFAIMFLWQMPHFWLLAIRYKDDYAKADVPTLPVAMGMKKTLFYVGLYNISYVTLALGSPWFVHAGWGYLAVVVPLSLKLLWEMKKYLQSEGEQNWLGFFMWINVSMLVYVLVPVFDKWAFLFIKSS